MIIMIINIIIIKGQRKVRNCILKDASMFHFKYFCYLMSVQY